MQREFTKQEIQMANGSRKRCFRTPNYQRNARSNMETFISSDEVGGDLKESQCLALSVGFTS